MEAAARGVEKFGECFTDLDLEYKQLVQLKGCEFNKNRARETHT